MSYGSCRRAFDNAFSISLTAKTEENFTATTAGVEDSFAANLSYGLFALATTLQRERAQSAALMAKMMLSLEEVERRLSAGTQQALPTPHEVSCSGKSLQTQGMTIAPALQLDASGLIGSS